MNVILLIRPEDAFTLKGTETVTKLQAQIVLCKQIPSVISVQACWQAVSGVHMELKIPGEFWTWQMESCMRPETAAR